MTEIQQNIALNELRDDWDEKFVEYPDEANSAFTSFQDVADQIKALGEEGHPGWSLEISREFNDVVEDVQDIPGPRGGTPLYVYFLLAIICAGGGLFAGTFLQRLKGPGKPSAEYLDGVLKGLEKTAQDIEEYRNSMAGIDEPEARETRLRLTQYRKQIESEVSNLKFFRGDMYE